MGFTEAIRSGFSNYVNFSGRAPRSEYWYWALFAFLVSIGADIIDYLLFQGANTPIAYIASLALLLPGIAVSVRRLHDIDRTGWWLLIVFTVIGIFVLVYWDLREGHDRTEPFRRRPARRLRLSPP